MKKYEYLRMEPCELHLLEEKINKAGSLGWELVCIDQHSFHFFKRELKEGWITRVLSAIVGLFNKLFKKTA